ncbi:MAG: YbhB/YbcL family Raf kinase inhibitor-like protein, partial [bacterium]
SDNDKRISVIYDLNGDKRSVNYFVKDGGNILFQFDNGKDGVETETYSMNEPRRGPQGKDQQKKGGQRKDQQKKGGGRPPEEPAPNAGDYVKISPKRSGNFVLSSPAVKNGDELPKEFNGDGEGATLPLNWKGAPEGTRSYALVMDHLAKGDEMKVYWVIWDIPSNVSSLPKNVKGVGRLGETWKRGESYVTPHSAGGGTKKYTLTVYALSDVPKLDPEKKPVTRDVLLTAIKGLILDSASLDVNYTRLE